MTVTEIIEALTPYTGEFPRAAMEAAVVQRDEIIPHLLRVLEEVAAAPEKFASQDYMLHLFATYLLAQFREKRAYGLLIRIAAAPGEVPDKLFGDTITERLQNILASVFDGDPSPLKRLVEGENVDEWVRGAAVQTFMVLRNTGQLSHQEVVDYYRDLFHGKLRREYSHVWDALVGAVADLPAPELIPEMRQAFEENLTDSFCAGLEELEQEALVPFDQKEQWRRNKLSAIGSDAISQMSWWAAFNRGQSAAGAKFCEVEQMPPPSIEPDEPHAYIPPTPIVRETPKIGRNDPCPCGSGKKYKKCCLGR